MRRRTRYARACAARTVISCYLLFAYDQRQRHERETWLAKNEAKLRREAALVAIAEDKARREERLAREAETRALVGRVPRPPLPPSGLEARSPPSAPGAAAEEDS